MSSFEILILSYNHPQITESAVLSALKHVSSSKINIVHNGSLEIHKNYLMTKYTDVNHIILTENRGFTGGANFGLRAVFDKTPWCLFLTNDCELLKLGDVPSQVSLCAAKVVSKKGDKVYSLGGLFDIGRGELRHCKSEDDFFSQNGLFKKYIPGSAFWIHKDVFNKTSGFDETLGTYWEDVEISLKAQQFGYVLGLAPETVVAHKVGKTCFGNTFYTTYLYQRNRKTISRKFISKSRRWLLEFHLAKSWTKLFFKNTVARDFQKNKLLFKAILE